MEDSARPFPLPGRNLTLIGTGHVLDIADQITGAIQALRPDVVFVELDHGRLQSLRQRRDGNAGAPAGTWLQRRLQSFQEGVAQEYGVQAGDEMLAAVDAGMSVGSRIELIDRPIQHTLQRVTKQISWTERFRLMGQLLGGSIKQLVTRQSAKQMVENELRDYNDDPQKTLTKLAEEYPTIYRVLIAERDVWMADRIAKKLLPGQQGLAVLGDGHLLGVIEHLDNIPLEIYRLPDVRDGRLPKPEPSSTSEWNIGFDVTL